MRCRTTIWVALAAVVIAAILDAPLAVADGPKEEGRGALFVMTNSAASDRGNLRLLDRQAGITAELPGGAVPGQNSQGSTLLDIRVIDQFVYNVLPGSGAVGAWRINEDGSLRKIAEYTDLPKTVDGDHAPFEFGPGGSPAGIAGY